MKRNTSAVWAQVWSPEDESKVLSNLETIHDTKKAEVTAFLISENLLGEEVVRREVSWFFGGLGLTPHYFVDFPSSEIAAHVRSLYAAKLLQVAMGREDVRFVLERESSAVYVVSSRPGEHGAPSVEVEHEIGAKYLRNGYRAAVHRSTGPISPDSQCYIRIYVVEKATFERASQYPAGDLRAISNDQFLRYAADNTRNIYAQLMSRALANLASGPIIEVFESSAEEKRLVVLYYHGGVGTGSKFFAGLSSLYRLHNLTATRKYVEFFSNGYVATSIFLRSKDSAAGATTPLGVEDISETLEKLRLDANLVYVIPCVRLLPFLDTNLLNVREAAYAYCAYSFTRHFVNRLGNDYWTVKAALGSSSYEALLERLRGRLMSESFPKQEMFDLIVANPALVRALYSDFALRARPAVGWEQDTLRLGAQLPHAELLRKIADGSRSELQRSVFEMFAIFNAHILRTNFFKEGKMAMAFRLDPGFLDRDLYPLRPYAINFIVGSLFRGFHVRFRDVARGGVRLITSRDHAQYQANLRNVFDECYNLANTQQRKNKDIPEGGSKGTILMRVDRQDHAHRRLAFYAYVDATLDLLLPHEAVRDGLRRDEVLFLGPDEGTAELMDWASEHARKRGAPFWKAFTTGKSRGGIPHDAYGMTTRGIHQYVLGILRECGLEERAVTKLQTGGPDGDLGSNEILISQDRTLAVVDGSGVLYDPSGIEREELARLARARKMVREFDRARLGAGGFFVDVEDVNARLPDGTLVERGVDFRNRFHTHPLAQTVLFVPCGGRPAAVSITNVDEVLRHWKYVVEGANLFFTQPARLKLEAAGVVLFKDASANKGGVTSSSMEVLSALALNDAEFEANMVRNADGELPPFYMEYVRDIWARIEENARLEFETLWKEHQASKAPISELSDVLSNKINDMNDSLQLSKGLWAREELKMKVFAEALPPSLVKLLGLQTILQRVPEPYLKAIWGAHLASRFVYKYGLSNSATEIIFFDYMMDKVQN